MFSILFKSNFILFISFILSSANAFNLNCSEILSFVKDFTFSHTSPSFYVFTVEQFLVFPQCLLSVCLVVVRFNGTLTAKVISWQSVTHVFLSFLTPAVTFFFFPKTPTIFFTCFCRGERRKYPKKKSPLNQVSLTITRS